MTGHVSLSHRKWISIDCSTVYRDVTVICEESYISSNTHHMYVDMVIYTTLLYSRIYKNSLKVPIEHCQSGWVHFTDGLCASFYVSIVNDKHGCEHVSIKQVHASLHTSLKSVANILQQFLEMRPGSASVHLAQCTEQLIFRNPVLDVYFQCYDGTLIIEHHLCDGEADCPDASDESNCSWVCQSLIPSIRYYDCFSNCTKPNCICHHIYFNCDSGGCVPFSKFCNGINDCPDSSDETLCPEHYVTTNYLGEHRMFSCLSGDEISMGRVNDTVPDCPIHGDDETWLSQSSIFFINHTVPLLLPCISGHPKMYNYYDVCLLTWQQYGELATCRNGGHLRDCVYHSCPEHYKCEYTYCIPLHAVCNGIRDCPDGEDEKHCEALSCPNTLKCKHDKVCIHSNYIYDGHIDCPTYADDEATALQIQCPKFCECIGNAAFCTGEDTFKFFSNLRFVTILICKNISYMEYTKNISAIALNSLKVLDISNNQLQGVPAVILHHLKSLVKLVLNNIYLSEIPPYIFDGLHNLRDLQVQKNSIRLIHTDGFNGLLSLAALDLSNLNIKTIMRCSFRGLGSLLHLNISHNKIELLNADIFCGLQLLQILDIQNNNILSVDANVFRFTTHLNTLMSNMAALCCYTNIKHCSPEFSDEFETCTNILHLYHGIIKFNIYNAGLLPLVTNGVAFCTVKLLFVEKTRKREVSNMFRKQSLFSDGTMGAYFLMLSVYDILYAGDFVTVRYLWEKSIQCRILGLISILSLEITLFVVLIIGIERFIAMCFPLKNIYISVKTAWIIIILAWLAAFTISFTLFLNLYLSNIDLQNPMCMTVLF